MNGTDALDEIPFLYSALVVDDTSPTGRRRTLHRGTVAFDVPRLDGFDAKIRTRHRMAEVKDQRIHEAAYGVVGRRLATTIDLETKIVVDFERQFQKDPAVLSGRDAYLGNLKRYLTYSHQQQHDRSFDGRIRLDDEPVGEVVRSDRDLQEKRALEVARSLVRCDGALYDLAVEPVIASRRKVNHCDYTDAYGRMVRRNVVDGWRHRHFSTFDDASQSFAPFMRLSAVADGEAYQIFDRLEVEGDLSRVDFHFPEASANVYEILKFMQAEILFARSTPERPWLHAEVDTRLETVMTLIATYEDVGSPPPDPVQAGAFATDLVDWSSTTLAFAGNAFATNAASGLSERFRHYWERRGERMARHERPADPVSVSSILDEDVEALEGLTPR